MIRETKLKLNMIIVFSTVVIFTGCGIVNNTNSNENNETNSNKESYVHLDKFSSLDINDFKQEEISTDIKITDDLPTLSEIQDSIYNDSEIKASEEDIRDNEDETPNNEISIDYSEIGIDSEIVKEVIKELYTTYSYTSHEVLNVYNSEIPELDGYEYSLALKFNTGEVYVVYKTGDKAYAIKDEYGVY